MDTNLKQNNIHVNSFIKGMNTDTSFDMVGSEQYVFGQNIRIANNTLLNSIITANSTENIVAPVSAGISVFINDCYDTSDTEAILATASIETIGAIITKSKDKHWHLYKVDFANDYDGELYLTHLFRSTDTTDKDKFSVIINKEIEGVTKLYIADGVHPIMSVNLLDKLSYFSHIETMYDNEIYSTEDKLCSNRLFPSDKIKIVKKISGILKTSLVLYTYRLYKKNGPTSCLAPLTNKILIISDYRNTEIGNKEDSSTTVGLLIQIDIPDVFYNVYDHVQVYRLSYVNTKDNTKIELISDSKINDKQIIINDTGINAVQELSIDEFSSMSGQTIIPQCIELNQGYMFAGNIVDESNVKLKDENGNQLIDTRAFLFNANKKCIYYTDILYTDSNSTTDKLSIDNIYLNKYSDINYEVQYDDNECKYDETGSYYGGTGKYISWRFVSKAVCIHSNYGMKKRKIPGLVLDGTDRYTDEKHIYYIRRKNNKETYVESATDIDQYIESIGVPIEENFDYNKIFTSSTLRSLKRDEVYRYGIVFYDKYGRRSDTSWIADIRTPTEVEYPCTNIVGESLYAFPIGILFNVDIESLSKYNIVGYEIVRCEKTPEYSSIICQGCISRPLRYPYIQGSTDNVENWKDHYTILKWSPYQPSPILTTKHPFIHGYGHPGWENFGDGREHDRAGHAWLFGRSDTNRLFQLMNSDTLIYGEELTSYLLDSNVTLNPICYIYGELISEDAKQFCNSNGENRLVCGGDRPWIYDVTLGTYTGSSTQGGGSNTIQWEAIPALVYFKKTNYLAINSSTWRYEDDNNNLSWTGDDSKNAVTGKEEDNNIFFNYNKIYLTQLTDYSFDTIKISNIKKAKDIKQNEGFTNVLISGGEILSASRVYKSYIDTIGEVDYNNWCSDGAYDLRTTRHEGLLAIDLYKDEAMRDAYVQYFPSAIRDDETTPFYTRFNARTNWIGPGPQCLLLYTEEPKENTILSEKIENYAGTVLCNIKHTAVQFAGLRNEDKLYDVYYGFGNFFKNSNVNCVFDGDIYITPCEIVNMFKIYDFNSRQDTLYSSLIMYYVPMESKINTFFDYGLNFLNTSSCNLSIDPISIDGIRSAERPLHLYNMVYSDNNRSNNVFNSLSLESNQYNFNNRICYSELKQNGEYIDSWQIFKATDFIDTDTRYGLITNLLTARNVLYYWQTQAFGKISVNERSLVTDENSNKVQLGQGGVLQRTDYIDTTHGMRELDFCSLFTENSIFWIDILNKAIMNYAEGYPMNVSESLNVQNLINANLDETLGANRPLIHYDMLNLELLCRCLKNGELLIFNLKTRCATSVYTRIYDNIITFNNMLFGLMVNNDYCFQYNYTDKNVVYLSPTKLSFIVNAVPSTTKVFDNQKIVLAKHNCNPSYSLNFMKNKQFTFSTELGQSIIGNLTEEYITDREGNICYCIPRNNDSANNIPLYGERTRGKWLKVDILNDVPEYDFNISHVITKFRLSFS